MKAFSPTGKLIIATCDTVCVNANIKIDDVHRNGDGTLDIDFAGESDVSWDSQRTLTDERGVSLYVADDGTEWPEDCLHLDGEEPRPMPAIPSVAPSAELIGTISRMIPYSIDSSDDVLEDAVATVNSLIAKARALVNAPAAPSPVTFSAREHATVLAALRHWQRHQANSVGMSPNVIAEDDIATNGGTLEPMRAADIDGLCDRLNLPPGAPSVDWRSIAQDLAGALNFCTDQIGQMSGMFNDSDGKIQESLDDAEHASDRYAAAVKDSPDAPAPATRTIWTLATDGDNCPLTISVHTTEADAMESVRGVLEDDCKNPEILARLETMTAAELSAAWEETNDGACIIESHEMPA